MLPLSMLGWGGGEGVWSHPSLLSRCFSLPLFYMTDCQTKPNRTLLWQRERDRGRGLLLLCSKQVLRSEWPPSLLSPQNHETSYFWRESWEVCVCVCDCEGGGGRGRYRMFWRGITIWVYTKPIFWEKSILVNGDPKKMMTISSRNYSKFILRREGGVRGRVRGGEMN